MPKENAGTQNESRRDAKTYVEEVGKARSEDKRDTKTKVEEIEVRVRPCARGSYVQGPCGTRGYTRAGPIIQS